MVCLGVEPGWQDGKRRRIHWAMAAPLYRLDFMSKTFTKLPRFKIAVKVECPIPIGKRIWDDSWLRFNLETVLVHKKSMFIFLLCFFSQKTAFQSAPLFLTRKRARLSEAIGLVRLTRFHNAHFLRFTSDRPVLLLTLCLWHELPLDVLSHICSRYYKTIYNPNVWLQRSTD